MTLGGIICIIIGFFAGLLSCNHRITDYDKAIVPIKGMWRWLKTKVTGKEKKEAKDGEPSKEEN